jgi:hypothetical protein
MNALRTTFIGAAAVLSFGLAAGPAFAGDNPDPYTYSYSPAAACADTCMVQQPIYDRSGQVVGQKTVNVCTH